jgi:hypothetical protein
LANFCFILVHKCTIKVPVASINSIFDCLGNLTRF